MVMTLAFSTIFPKGKPGLEGKETLFIEKIWSSLLIDPLIGVVLEDYEESMKEHVAMFGDPWDGNKKGFVRSKIHTIRRDEMDRWKQGNKIHMAVRNRTPDRFQFAPVVNCTGIETIKIKWFYGVGNSLKLCRVFVGSKEIGCGVWNKHHESNPIFTGNELVELVKNDGFDSIQDFFAWFNEDFTGKIIHWTPFRYDTRSIEVINEQIIK
jgi:hypothetical protein